MKEIFVFAKVKGGKQFIGMYGSMESLLEEVDETLEEMNKTDLVNDVYFLSNGEEYKLLVG
ncbi:hypothetical protein LHA31_10205 [Carnobacterium viridans]|uniref:Uncharacterized protein n=1 Tax=Carnobacterium viridans TaxID=174587 RepID=A0A1H0YVS7_9LACT|nr:hypothetical protein [Carnobacterium viridans]UDE94917.1 hypothetical protein LHA31_10205 [Carnobacterium viridans]SDQ19337.1 hypothetical protein SAMN04487752_1185 [Carnobacterium viridans]